MYSNAGYWIGIRIEVHSLTHDSKDFYYVSRAPKNPSLAYDGWGKGEPNNLDNKEDCVRVSSKNMLEWADDNCAKKMFSICEFDQDKGRGNIYH